MRITFGVVVVVVLCCLGCKRQQAKQDIPVYFQTVTPEVKALKKKAVAVRRTDVKGSLVYYRNMLQTATERHDKIGMLEAYRSLVFVSGALLNQTDTAIQISNKAIAFAHQLGDANSLCDMYSMRAVTYQAAGQLDSAVAVNKTALKYMDDDTAPDSLKNWPLYLNIADLYSNLGNQNLAIEYTEKYLNGYALKINDTMRIITSYNNLSVYHTLQEDTAAAYTTTYKAYRLLQRKPNDPNEASVYSNMFAMYNNRRMYDSAYYFSERYLQVAKASHDEPDAANALFNLLEVGVESENKVLLRRLLAENNLLSLTANEPIPLKIRKNIAEEAYKAYHLLNNNQMAYTYLQTAYDLSVTLRKQEINKDLEKYELERKRVMQENVILANELQLKKKNNTILWLAIALLAIAFVAVAITLHHLRKVALNQKRLELLQKEKEWDNEKALLQGQLDERNRISRELHDDLGASLTTIALAGEVLKQQNPALKNDLQTITSSANEIVDNLNEIVWSLNSRNDSLHGLVAYIRKFATSFLQKAGISLHIHDTLPGADLSVTSNIRRMLYLTTKEAIHNLVKHSGATTAQLQFMYTNNQLLITIANDGKGSLGKIIGGGNGLHNMHKNMELINGTCSIDQQNGFTVTITSPILI